MTEYRVCKAGGCSRRAMVKLALQETTPNRRKYLCGEHATSEEIGSPDHTRRIASGPFKVDSDV